ncbi:MULTISPECIES: hypothetical protein [Pseudoalteromonas]|uniref:hypothetical protein n=1 Tax=Pseudoalteromonas TaxID=53246 RepID=UPI000AD6F86B|nr:hypothetical protein [Pseudoalteromonas porphyrae]
MTEKASIKEIPEPINVTISVDEDNQVIVEAIDKLTAGIPKSSGIESLIQDQNLILSSLVDIAKVPPQPDFIPYYIALTSIVISLIALYLSHWHKSSKSVLCLNSRLFGCTGKKTTRELSYTYSNTGNQELFVKDISLLRGQSPLGHLKHNSSFLVIPSNSIEPFIIKPGEIKTFMLSHDLQYDVGPDYDEALNKYILVSLEVISVNGGRYQVVHDISDLGPSGPDIKDKIWRGVPLGSSI